MKEKVLVVSDIHGRHEAVTNAFAKFYSGGYTKIVFTGDFADARDKSDEDILRGYKIAIDEKRKDERHHDIILLYGNHDIQYFFDNPEFSCTGYRHSLAPALKAYLAQNRNVFQAAYGIGNYLFTHAGVTEYWFEANQEVLEKWAGYMDINIHDRTRFWELLNGIMATSDMPILHQVGYARGGEYLFGGITWADASELKGEPLKGLHQVVGHTHQPSINTITKFGRKQEEFPNTSVTFIDVLGIKEEFLTLEIEK